MTDLLIRERLDELFDEETWRAMRRQRVFRDRRNPLDRFDDLELYQRFRLRREGIIELTDLLKVDLERKTKRSHAVPSVLQASICFIRSRFKYSCRIFPNKRPGCLYIKEKNADYLSGRAEKLILNLTDQKLLSFTDKRRTFCDFNQGNVDSE